MAAAGEAGRSDLELLKVALLNEKGAPEVLEFQTELVERLHERMLQGEAAVKELDEQKAALVDSDGAESNPRELLDLEHTIFAEDLARLRFLLKEYLRTRLAKIQKHSMHFMDDEAERAKLSPAERDFARDYTVTVIRHLNDNVLSFLPEAYQDAFSQIKDSRNAKDMVARPNLDHYTFVLAEEDIKLVQVGPGSEDVDQVEDVKKGAMVVMRYEPRGYAPAEGDPPTVRKLVGQGLARLV